MGPEDSEKKAVKAYMMVDGQPVEIAPEIAEIKLPEVQQSGDVLPSQECEITVEAHLTAPLIHGWMIYRCENCGKSWNMYLEKGIEEFGEDHKPSPFTIGCPYCGGWASDVSGIQKAPGGGYVPLPEGGHYFANREKHPCGVPTFTVRLAGNLVAEDASALIEDIREHLKSREMEMYRDAMREEQACMEEVVKRTVPDEAEAVKRTSVIIAKRAGASLEEAVAIVMKAMKAIRDFGNGLQTALAPYLGELDPTMLEPGESLDIPTLWDRKEAREKRRAVERAASSRFRQYKTRERAWTARKRTGPRRREWRGADRV